MTEYKVFYWLIHTDTILEQGPSVMFKWHFENPCEKPPVMKSVPPMNQDQPCHWLFEICKYPVSYGCTFLHRKKTNGGNYIALSI